MEIEIVHLLLRKKIRWFNSKFDDASYKNKDGNIYGGIKNFVRMKF